MEETEHDAEHVPAAVDREESQENRDLSARSKLDCACAIRL